MDELSYRVKSDRHRKTNTTWNHLHMESKKKDANECVYKTELESWMKKTNLRFPEAERGQG